MKKKNLLQIPTCFVLQNYHFEQMKRRKNWVSRCFGVHIANEYN